MVGCDGANSVVRAALGIELVGVGTIGHPVHMFFRKPNLLERLGRARVPSSFRLTATACGAACASSILRTAYGA